MKTFFYVIEWHDGSGKTSGLVHASNADDAFYEVVRDTREAVSPKEIRPAGDVITFNQVDGSHD